MSYFLLAIIFALFILGVHLVKTFSNTRKNSRLFNLVSWCTSKSDRERRYNLSLLDHLHNAQIELNINASFRVAGNCDRSYAKQILDGFTSYLSDSFYCEKIDYNYCNLKKLYRYARVDGYPIEMHFFMFQLFEYLFSHRCDYDFLDNKMHKNVLEYKQYGSWGGTLFDATYELSDFAVVVFKMMYISYKFCRNSTVYSSVVSSKTEQFITETISSKRIDISRF